MATKENAPAGTEAGYFKTLPYHTISLSLVNIGVAFMLLLAWAGWLD